MHLLSKPSGLHFCSRAFLPLQANVKDPDSSRVPGGWKERDLVWLGPIFAMISGLSQREWSGFRIPIKFPLRNLSVGMAPRIQIGLNHLGSLAPFQKFRCF